jgi:hypothetical protein
MMKSVPLGESPLIKELIEFASGAVARITLAPDFKKAYQTIWKSFVYEEKQL